MFLLFLLPSLTRYLPLLLILTKNLLLFLLISFVDFHFKFHPILLLSLLSLSVCSGGEKKILFLPTCLVSLAGP